MSEDNNRMNVLEAILKTNAQGPCTVREIMSVACCAANLNCRSAAVTCKQYVQLLQRSCNVLPWCALTIGCQVGTNNADDFDKLWRAHHSASVGGGDVKSTDGYDGAPVDVNACVSGQKRDMNAKFKAEGKGIETPSTLKAVTFDAKRNAKKAGGDEEDAKDGTTNNGKDALEAGLKARSKKMGTAAIFENL